MTVNLGLRRIVSLSAFLVATGIASATQAGIIPWAYDAIFGPVRYPAYGYGYSPYYVSYSRPVYVRSSPAYTPVSYGYSSGCSSCSTSYYAPVSYAAPSYGCGCGPVVAAPSCGPCGGASYASAGGCLSGCSATTPSTPAPATKPATNGKSAWNSTKKPGEPVKDAAPSPTFQEPDRGATPAGATSSDGIGSGIRQRGTRTDEPLEVEVNRPAEGNDEPTLAKPKKTPAKTPEDLFDNQPETNPTKPTSKKVEEPIENKDSNQPESNPETTILRKRPQLNLDGKIAWQSELQRSRVPYHAKLAKATVTRRAPNSSSDWTPVVAKSTGTQVVQK